jgi:hypothetical protein
MSLLAMGAGAAAMGLPFLVSPILDSFYNLPAERELQRELERANMLGAALNVMNERELMTRQQAEDQRIRRDQKEAMGEQSKQARQLQETMAFLAAMSQDVPETDTYGRALMGMRQHGQTSPISAMGLFA